ncbi:hypothetical protein [Bradyrhizobium sp. RP6]|uniref:hypothetical protein n=1 Tax=Bradyrhizobium sp. RP6 TaxID=2489596 RepID=UPI000F5452B3|nr:hypothetical protein [Bradyrhizobium sp. RP6]RQH12658.1 hypothetical protein EHH60_14295 [Bradyrhizobium sp. RP6]
MAKKMPVTVFVDPDVETTFTIKPLAAGLAKQPKPIEGEDFPEGVTGSATATGVGQPNPDVDGAVDYQ